MMKTQKQIKRWLSVLLSAALLFSAAGTAFAWVDFSQEPWGGNMKQYSIGGYIDMIGGFVASADGETWQHSLPIRDIFMQKNPSIPVTDWLSGYDCTLSLPTVSFDPNRISQSGFAYWPTDPSDRASAHGSQPYYASLPATVCQAQSPGSGVIEAQTMVHNGVGCGVFYLRQDIWQSYAVSNADLNSVFHLEGHALCSGMPDDLHIMLDLRYLKSTILQNTLQNDPSLNIPDWMIIFGSPYMPLNVNGGIGTWQDLDANGVCSPNEIGSNLSLGSTALPYSNALPSGIPYTAMSGGMIPVPVLIWREGQTMQSGGGSYTGSTENIQVHIHVGDDRFCPAPIDYREETDSVTGLPYYSAVGLANSTQFWAYDGAHNILASGADLNLMQNSGFLFDSNTETFFLPQHLDGIAVRAMDVSVFNSGLFHNAAAYSDMQARTFVVPDTVECIEDSQQYVLHPQQLQRLHLPSGVQFTELYLDSCTTVCTSTYDPALDAYCQAKNIPYEVCAGHIPLHTHTFNSVVTPPTYHANGYTTFTCTGCTGSYTAAGSAMLSLPTLSLTGGSAEPGDTVDVTVDLTDNAGLDGVTLLPQYDPQTLALEAVNAAQGLTAAVVPDAGGGLPTVSVTTNGTFGGASLCTLVFRVLSGAAAGDRTVQMTASLTPPAAHADPVPVALAASQTIVTVLPASVPAPALTVQCGSGTPGTLVPVTVRLENNPGLVSMMMEIEYDTDALELDHIDDCGLFGSGTTENPRFTAGRDTGACPYKVCWSDDDALQPYTQSGDLAVIWLRVRTQTATGAYNVTVRSAEHSTLDIAADPVSVASGTDRIQVSALAGDANGDGVVNAADALAIRQSLHNPGADPISPVNADVDGDGAVTENDAAVLLQSIADN